MSSAFGSFAEFVKERGNDFNMYNRYGPMWKEEVHKVQVEQQQAEADRQRQIAADRQIATQRALNIQRSTREAAEYAATQTPGALKEAAREEAERDRSNTLALSAQERKEAEATRPPTALENLEDEEARLDALANIRQDKRRLQGLPEYEDQEVEDPWEAMTQGERDDLRVSFANRARREASEGLAARREEFVEGRGLFDFGFTAEQEEELEALGDRIPAGEFYEGKAQKGELVDIHGRALKPYTDPSQIPPSLRKRVDREAREHVGSPSRGHLKATQEPPVPPEGASAPRVAPSATSGVEDAADARIAQLRAAGMSDDLIRQDTVLRGLLAEIARQQRGQ
jgi:hypothetical protein